MGADPAHAADDRRQVIRLWLMRSRDMFELPQPDLFSEYRNFLTGVDFCLSELRGRVSFRPVRLEIYLPSAEIHDDAAEQLGANLRRYCANRIRYNRRESRAQRFEGVSALRVGVPICLLGLVLTIAASAIKPASGIAHILSDQLGWVLIWIGLWFPLDQMLFYPLAYGRESRALRLLGNADVTVSPHPPSGGPEDDAAGTVHLDSRRGDPLLERDPWRRNRPSH
jgi:hypothetical protein